MTCDRPLSWWDPLVGKEGWVWGLGQEAMRLLLRGPGQTGAQGSVYLWDSLGNSSRRAPLRQALLWKAVGLEGRENLKLKCFLEDWELNF